MAEATFSLDLHVLSPPLTFALSQDQTLHRKFENWSQRRLVSYASGGRRSVRRGSVFVSNKNPNLPNLACYPVFRDRSPTRSILFVGPDGECRRGMLLIRDDFSFVNGDRKNFPPSRPAPAILRSSRRFRGEKFYPIHGPGSNNATGRVDTTRTGGGKTSAATA